MVDCELPRGAHPLRLWPSAGLRVKCLVTPVYLWGQCERVTEWGSTGMLYMYVDARMCTNTVRKTDVYWCLQLYLASFFVESPLYFYKYRSFARLIGLMKDKLKLGG